MYRLWGQNELLHAEFENIFMCLANYFFAITKDIVLFKIYFESSESSSSYTITCTKIYLIR